MSVAACVLFGLDSLRITQVLDRKLDIFQRRLIMSIVKPYRFNAEPLVDYIRRSNAFVSDFMENLAKWSSSRRTRYFRWCGHVARMSSEHLCSSVLKFRSMA